MSRTIIMKRIKDAIRVKQGTIFRNVYGGYYE